MSNFKPGDKVVCVLPAEGYLIKDKVYILTDVVSCPDGWVSVSFGTVCNDRPLCTCPCCGRDLRAINEIYCNASRFRKVEPTEEHSTRTIKNLSVVKKLSRLPLVKETTEVPVKKQEGVEM